MTDQMDQDPLEAARRYVQEGEIRLLHQAALVEEQLCQGLTLAAARSKKLLAAMEQVQLERRGWLAREEWYARQQRTDASPTGTTVTPMAEPTEDATKAAFEIQPP
jgi:hypothetical protein